jgi:hypothetical protein
VSEKENKRELTYWNFVAIDGVIKNQLVLEEIKLEYVISGDKGRRYGVRYTFAGDNLNFPEHNFCFYSTMDTEQYPMPYN